MRAVKIELSEEQEERKRKKSSEFFGNMRKSEVGIFGGSTTLRCGGAQGSHWTLLVAFLLDLLDDDTHRPGRR